MLRHVILATFLLVATAVSGCRADQTISLSSGVSALSQNPVYVTELLLDDKGFVLIPTVSHGGADSFPRTSATTGLSIALPDKFTVKATWVEIISGRAYEAQAVVNFVDLAIESGMTNIVVVLMPGGRMIIGSDPVPRSGKIMTRDIADVCGTRRPDLDRDMKTEIDAIAGVKEAYQFATNPITAPPCSEGS